MDLFKPGHVYILTIPYDSSAKTRVKGENPDFIFIGNVYLSPNLKLRKNPCEDLNSDSYISTYSPFMVLENSVEHTQIIQTIKGESRIGYVKFYSLDEGSSEIYRDALFPLHVYGLGVV